MSILLLVILAVIVGVGVKWLVGAKEEFFDIFDPDQKND